MVERSGKRGSRTPLAELRRSTAADHEAVDDLIDPTRLVAIDYYATVMRGLIDPAEMVEMTLPSIAPLMCHGGLPSAAFSKRSAIDAESSFLDELAAPRPVRRRSGGVEEVLPSGRPTRGSAMGLLYVYIGSALGGLHMLRVARTAPWWRPERQDVLLQPYGRHLANRWQAVLDALEHLDADETVAAVDAARAGFDLHRRSLVDHLSIGVNR